MAMGVRAEVFKHFKVGRKPQNTFSKLPGSYCFNVFFFGGRLHSWWRLFTVISQLLRLNCPQKAGWKHFTWSLNFVCWTYVTKTWEGCFFQNFKFFWMFSYKKTYGQSVMAFLSSPQPLKYTREDTYLSCWDDFCRTEIASFWLSRTEQQWQALFLWGWWKEEWMALFRAW